MRRPQGNLAGRIALVTGGSAGIGFAIARELAAKGARVLIHGVESEQAADAARDLCKKGLEAVPAAHDLADSRSAEMLYQNCVDAFGTGPDILVLSASIEIRQTIDELSSDAMAAQEAVNLRATMVLLKLCLPAMRYRRWGRVLAIGSVQETRPNSRHIYYAALKAAQTAVLMNLAKHESGEEKNLTFNVIRPGAIETDRNRTLLADPRIRADVIQTIPSRRIGRPEDISGVATILCSDDGSYMNGSIIDVDGGLHL